MANITPAQYVLSPSQMIPGVILPYTQASGAFALLADEQPLVRLNEGDLAVYMARMDLRTKVAAGQSAYNSLPSCSTALNLISTPTYLLRVRAEYDHHDAAAMGRYGVSIAEVQQLGMRQAHFQLARSALLYGFNPAGGEGLLNAPGVTTVSLPADSNGNQTAASYDNGQMAMFLLSQVVSIRGRTNQAGQQGGRIVICGPQRILLPFEIANIVQVTQFQRPGGGTATTGNVVKDVLAESGLTVEWVYDDTLQGKGAGGSDAVIIIMPEVRKPTTRTLNTNIFATIAPGIEANSLMLADMAAPREIPTPLPFGAIDIGSEWRITSGWLIRPEAATIVSMVPQ